MDDQNKNLILATALSFLVILVWFLLFPPEEQAPNPTPPTPEELAQQDLAPVPGTVTTPAAGTGPVQPATETAEAPRVRIETPALSGSLSLVGGRIDDLSLKRYRDSLEEDAGIVRLLSPVGDPDAYYALYGWRPAGRLGGADVPDPDTQWEVETGDVLTPDSPITLSWDSPAGLTFRRTISIDEDYLFTIRQSVENTGTEAARMAPYGLIRMHSVPDDLKGFFIIHEGLIRRTDGELEEVDFDDMADFAPVAGEGPAELVDVTSDGWIGFTEHYWMTALIPEPGTPFAAVARYAPQADIFQSEARLPVAEVAPGETVEATQYLFAGAKEWETIREYENRAGIAGFIDAIDWGWFFFLTKPIFAALHFLNGLIGNMGWAIIVLTLCIKAILFPLAYKSYVSMARMKELQPEMEKIKEKAGDDRQKLQQEMIKLYKEQKVNPAAGCLPLLLQIPIFFSLYKVIFVTLELRHAPFIGWIRDLSAPDPSSIINLFGILPWEAPEPGSILALIFIGLLPILLGISMWLQQKLNPAPADPTQAMIFAYMPWVFMFMLGGFASGLVIYWIANNTITFTQQYVIMRSQGYKPDVFGNIMSGFRRGKPAEKK